MGERTGGSKRCPAVDVRYSLNVLLYSLYAASKPARTQWDEKRLDDESSGPSSTLFDTIPFIWPTSDSMDSELVLFLVGTWIQLSLVGRAIQLTLQVGLLD